MILINLINLFISITLVTFIILIDLETKIIVLLTLIKTEYWTIGSHF